MPLEMAAAPRCGLVDAPAKPGADILKLIAILKPQ